MMIRRQMRSANGDCDHWQRGRMGRGELEDCAVLRCHGGAHQRAEQHCHAAGRLKPGEKEHAVHITGISASSPSDVYRVLLLPR